MTLKNVSTLLNSICSSHEVYSNLLVYNFCYGQFDKYHTKLRGGSLTQWESFAK